MKLEKPILMAGWCTSAVVGHNLHHDEPGRTVEVLNEFLSPLWRPSTRE